MSTYTGTVSSVCPFYLREADKSISCEGMTKDQTFAIKFSRLKEKTKYQENYCFNLECFKKCPIANILIKKYEGDV